jgi:hypothetical protein
MKRYNTSYIFSFRDLRCYYGDGAWMVARGFEAGLKTPLGAGQLVHFYEE